MDNQELFLNMMLNEKVCLKPHQLHKNYQSVVLSKIKARYEGRCTRHGLVLQGSIALHKVSPGNIRQVSLNGDIVYNVQFNADICNPAVGQVVKAHIVNSNKFGILAEVRVPVQQQDGSTVQMLVLEIIATKQAVGFQHDVPLDTLSIGDDVSIEVLGKKFDLNEQKISIVGRVVSEKNAMGPHEVTEEPEDAMLDKELEQEYEDDMDDDAGSDEDLDEESRPNEPLGDDGDDLEDIEDVEDADAEDADDDLVDIEDFAGGSDLDILDDGDDVGSDVESI
jgi:DNA-directed RNA polymerase subunit E'/Rpb7